MAQQLEVKWLLRSRGSTEPRIKAAKLSGGELVNEPPLQRKQGGGAGESGFLTPEAC